MSKKKAVKAKKARGIRNLPAKTLPAKQAGDVKAGWFNQGFLTDANTTPSIPTTHFTYDIKA